MNTPRFALLYALLAFCSSPLAQADVTSALPSIVQDAGWPVDAKGVVCDMQAVRLTGSLETEQAILIDDNLYLAFRPGRYSDYVKLASRVRSMQVVPNVDGTESLILVQNSGVVALRWDWNHAGYVVIQSLPAELDSWSKVQQLWVQEAGDVQILYGHDRGSGKVRRAQHRLGVWTALEPLACHGSLREMAFVELDAGSPGEEMVWLQKYALYVMSADGLQVLQKLPAHASDCIAIFHDPNAATADLLVQSYVEDGEHWLRAWNETQSSPGYSLGERDCTSILPRSGGQYGDHLLLTRGGFGDVDILELHSSTGEGGLVLERNADGAWIDTHESSEQMPVQAAALVDLDLDGHEDLMVAVLNGDNLELRNVMTRSLKSERWQNLAADEPDLVDLGNGEFELKVTMQVPEVLASTTVQVDVWGRKNPGTPEETLHALGRQFVTINVGDTQHEFTQTFSGTGWDPTDSQYEMGFVSVELDLLGNVTRLFPSQGLIWAAPGAPSALVEIGIFWLNAAITQVNRQRQRFRRGRGPTPTVGVDIEQ
ncbi:MAG: hypothetical protein ACI87O_000938 [Planctomycetota bacterium]|jgi:hypothetical protein